jgi:hypothetical protein
MIRRLTFCAVFSALCALAFATPALAWSNGPDGRDTFGTHDWILTEALTQAAPGWVETATALAATDDPDTVLPMSDRPNHAWRASGTYRGGPQTVTDYYHLTMQAYRQGDYHNASHYLGMLSHYYSDLCVPFHTSYTAGSHEILHVRYELQVDTYLRAPGDNASWITTAPRVPMTDVRKKAIGAALTSRGFYDSLVVNYGAYGYDVVVDLITRDALSRAVNGFADIISAIPSGTGEPTAGPIRISLSTAYPRQEQTMTATARVLTPSNKALQGARVTFLWDLPAGPVSTFAFADDHGYVSSECNIGRTPTGTVTPVRAEVTMSGVTTSAEATFTPTDVIGAIATAVSTSTPVQETTVTVTTQCLTKDDVPIQNLKVTFYWIHRTRTVSYTTYTDANGIAQQTRNIGKAAAGKAVTVKAKVPAGGTVRYASAKFTPKAKPKPKPKPKPKKP